MNEHAWVTDFMGDIRLVLGLTADICARDLKEGAEASRLLKSGQPVPPELRPRAVWMDKGKKGPQKFPALFYANGYWIVSREVADTLERFDLGAGGLFPVQVLRSDRETPAGGEWFCWIFGNQKDTLDAEASVNLKQRNPHPESIFRNLASHPADGDVALSSAALLGPDVWVEKRLTLTVLLSGTMGDALVSAGFGKALRLTRARVLK
ncbi:MAG: imm11 family protein [Novosphingobium sp.]